MSSRNKPLDWSATAAQELIDGLVHIAEDSPQGARLVKGRIDRAGRFLELNPRMGKPGAVAGTREHPVPKTRYTLIYEEASARSTSFIAGTRVDNEFSATLEAPGRPTHAERRMMNIKYFQDTDTLYIEFHKDVVTETRDLDEDTLLDLNAAGNIVAITVEHAPKRRYSSLLVRAGGCVVRASRPVYACESRRWRHGAGNPACPISSNPWKPSTAPAVWTTGAGWHDLTLAV